MHGINRFYIQHWDGSVAFAVIFGTYEDAETFLIERGLELDEYSIVCIA